MRAMQVRLSSLLLLLALGPPVLAGLWLLLADPWPVPLTELIVFGTVAATATGLAALGAVTE
jgi:hypothetical protein